MVDLRPSQPHPRYERGHLKQPIFEKEETSAGIRTFYGSRMRDGEREYMVEDRMQRKVRADQYLLRKSAFRNEALGMTQVLPRMRD
jgi:hypothetical protein